MEESTESTPEATVVGVQVNEVGRIYHFDPGSLSLEAGDQVVVSMGRGITLATVVVPPRRPSSVDNTGISKVIKKADPRDLAREEANRERAHTALRVCFHRIEERRLPMKLLQAECAFDSSKITFYFSSEGRVDFRDLVRDLAHSLNARIEMKQIGSRDEAKKIGGVGPCGRELCCASWLRDFAPVSLNMAKKQGLSLKPSRLAGMCGRLKCCLRYEYDTYLELGRPLPSVGKHVVSVKGDGVVVSQNVLKQTVSIRRDEDGVRVEATLDEIVRQKAP